MSTFPLIGILGGTFDPIHSGHLQIATLLVDEYAFDEVRFIPCKQPVHRAEPWASPTQRVEMIRLALEDNPRFYLDLREINREESSYMIDTMITLREDYPQKSLCLILGMDAFNQITTWKKWEKLLEFGHFIVVNRPNIDLSPAEEIQTLIKNHQAKNIEDLKKSLAGKILTIKMTPNVISATMIREKLLAQQNVTDLLPKKVIEYINMQHLYREPAKDNL